MPNSLRGPSSQDENVCTVGTLSPGIHFCCDGRNFWLELFRHNRASEMSWKGACAEERRGNGEASLFEHLNGHLNASKQRSCKYFPITNGASRVLGKSEAYTCWGTASDLTRIMSVGPPWMPGSPQKTLYKYYGLSFFSSWNYSWSHSYIRTYLCSMGCILLAN